MVDETGREIYFPPALCNLNLGYTPAQLNGLIEVAIEHLEYANSGLLVPDQVPLVNLYAEELTKLADQLQAWSGLDPQYIPASWETPLGEIFPRKLIEK